MSQDWASLTERNRSIYDDHQQLVAEGMPLTKADRLLSVRYGLATPTIGDIRRSFERYAAAPTNGQSKAQRAGMSEIGVSGLDYSHGYVNEEFLVDLNTSAKRYKRFNEMRQNSAVIASGLLAIELMIRRIDWRIETGEDDESDERKDFIDGAREDMSTTWDDHISEALTMVPFGFAPFEIVYKRRVGPLAPVPSQFNDGKVGWRKLAFRSQDSLDRWQFDDGGGLQAMVQRAVPDWQEHIIPIEKMVLYRTTREKGNPEGRSLLRAAYVPYYYAKNLMSVEAIGIERDLTGLPVVYMGKTAQTKEGTTDYTQATTMVRNVRNDEQAGLVIPNPKDAPDGWAFELVSSPGSKQIDIGAVIARHERRMALAFLSQFLMLGMDAVGSFSLSQDHSDFFTMAIGALADSIAQTFSQYAIPRLLKLNGMAMEDPPKLQPGPVGRPDLEALGNFLSQLVNSQVVIPDTDLESWVRDGIDAPAINIQEREKKEAEREANKEAMQKMLQDKGKQDNQDQPEEKQSAPQNGNGNKPPSKQDEKFQAAEGDKLKWNAKPDPAGLALPSAFITEEDYAAALRDMQKARVPMERLKIALDGD
jgi:phage gp29-like protein